MNTAKFIFSLSLLTIINLAHAMEMEDNNNNNNARPSAQQLLPKSFATRKIWHMLHKKKSEHIEYYAAFFNDDSFCYAQKENEKTKSVTLFWKDIMTVLEELKTAHGDTYSSDEHLFVAVQPKLEDDRNGEIFNTLQKDYHAHELPLPIKKEVTPTNFKEARKHRKSASADF